MKKVKVLLLGVIFGIIFSVCAKQIEPDSKREKTLPYACIAFSPEWTPIQISCMPLFLCDYNKSDVYGINIGTFALQRKIFGISAALMTMAENNGITISALSNLGISRGIAAAPVNMLAENCGVSLGIFNVGLVSNCENYGIQIGLINEASFGLQIGLLNCNENALIPWMPLFNFSFKKKDQNLPQPTN